MSPNKEEEEQNEMQEYSFSGKKHLHELKNGYSLISCYASIPRLYNLSPPSSGE